MLVLLNSKLIQHASINVSQLLDRSMSLIMKDNTGIRMCEVRVTETLPLFLGDVEGVVAVYARNSALHVNDAAWV